jgi:hypothetical protein
MLNAKGVVYKPTKESMSDNNNEDEHGNKEGNSTLKNPYRKEEKDFQDVDPVESTDNVSLKDSFSEKEVEDAEIKSMNGTDAQHTTPANHGASQNTPIQLEDEDSNPQSSSSIPITDLIVSKKIKQEEEDHVMDLTQEGSAESNSFDSLNTLCKKAIESGKKENAVGKRKRKIPSKLCSPYVMDKRRKRHNDAVKKGIASSFTLHVIQYSNNIILHALTIFCKLFTRIVHRTHKQ